MIFDNIKDGFEINKEKRAVKIRVDKNTGVR